MKPFKQMLIMAALGCFTATVWAGQACKQDPLKIDAWLHASRTALAVQKKLDASHSDVALIARVGSNLGQYGVYYTHIAFVVKEQVKGASQWSVIHLLNTCGTHTSLIYKQGLMNFFLDDLYTQDELIMTLQPAYQAKLLPLLDAKAISRYHQRNYNMLAYPYSDAYQNSNQWVLEVLASALAPQSLKTRKATQAFLWHSGYQGFYVHVNPLSSIGASLFAPHIRFDDHPRSERATYRFSTVSVASIVRYLKKQHVISGIIATHPIA